MRELGLSARREEFPLSACSAGPEKRSGGRTAFCLLLLGLRTSSLGQGKLDRRCVVASVVGASYLVNDRDWLASATNADIVTLGKSWRKAGNVASLRIAADPNGADSSYDALYQEDNINAFLLRP
ncbi:hypothetical protein MRX96_030643 [Rhipicephalus microplus]